MAEYGTLSNTGWGFWYNGATPLNVLYVCLTCGAVVFNESLHDKFHE